MTPELLLAIGPSLVAIAVAFIGAWTQWRSRIADDARFAAQREADDQRWSMQREADESRMKLQISAEAEALVAAHVRDVELKVREERSAFNRERAERLRREAATFVTIFGEAEAVVVSIAEALQKAVSARDWESRDAYFAPWTSDIQARLAAATAAMRIIGGGDAANLARQAHQNLRSDVDLMDTLYKQQNASCPTFFSWFQRDKDLEDFTGAVSTELAQLAVSSDA